ncbi:MAG: prolipoprotein diacylglyceryl transferase [Bacteroidetes bacterium]|nr:prolipoprotein diacylglyceryl transferase [Bacteroidota bacterium]
MFPKITDLVNFLLGTNLDLPIQTYGFFLALGFITGGIILWSELKRKELEGKLPPYEKVNSNQKKESWPVIILGASLSAIIAFKFIGIAFHYSEFANNPQDYLVSGQGNWIAAVILFSLSAGFSLYRNRKSRQTNQEFSTEIIHPYQNTWNIVVVAIVSALIGSKLFDILDNFQGFLDNPIHSLFSFSGLTFYGGLIVTVITLIYYMRVIHLDWKQVIDATAPAIMLGYAIGRMGCHLSGDGCWGIANELSKPHWLSLLPDWAWSYSFPHNVINQGGLMQDCTGSHCHVLDVPVWPTSLYESTISLLFFLVLWKLRTKMRAPVTLFGVFLVLNGIERFFIEKIRVNNRMDIAGLHPTQAEIISFTLFFLGLFILWYYQKKHTAKPTSTENETT